MTVVQVLHLHVTRLQEKNGLFGEFLTNAQGEDVVLPVFVLQCTFPKWKTNSRKHSKQFKEVCSTLENHYRDMQDMEFTVEHG